MPRSKSSVPKKARTKKVLAQSKGYYGKRKNLFSAANQSVVRSGAFALAHRRKKKGDFRRLWNIRINAGVRKLGLTYSRFIAALKNSNILLNRKALAYLAAKDPVGFKAVVDRVNGKTPASPQAAP